jgi:hypothetical protein
MYHDHPWVAHLYEGVDNGKSNELENVC